MNWISKNERYAAFPTLPKIGAQIEFVVIIEHVTVCLIGEMDTHQQFIGTHKRHPSGDMKYYSSNDVVAWRTLEAKDPNNVNQYETADTKIK
ncbi:hypothetical protein [Pleionea sp. CnH1-48]|uniref:hypothetical protein n=1 Tax=Pleionea sp. CnH1-48 TaxID=2954494 RepID=UPI0020984BC9|nr:hypothetical protein [Pleionea sp. CnH1-48]MCO7224254.1 hypothetical protein [Pleionea sp. CnH1-48]